MKVSVLLTTYNHERYIGEAIESALMQETDFDFEIVVSEDCSTDNTRAIVERYRTRHPDRIRARYSPENRGEETWVRSYHACRGRYVALLDGDDYWTSPQKLQKEADFLDHHPECSMCGHAMAVIHENGGEPPIYWIHPDQKEISTLEDVILNNFIYTASAMLRKEVFNDHPRWVYDSPFSDYPLWIQAARRGPIGYLKEFLGVYRIHRGGLWSAKPTSSQLEDLISFHSRMRQELGPDYDHVYERVLARFHGQLACERAEVSDEAEVLVLSGGDPELIKVRPKAKHFPQQAGADAEAMSADELLDQIQTAQQEGAEFLLFPRTASRLADSLRPALASRYVPVWDDPEALLYDLRGRTAEWTSRRTVKSTATVAVVIPCYNLGEYLDEAVTSVLEQTVEDVEIVIVNDGSTDPFSKELLRGYDRPKTTVLQQDNQGLGTARNNGIAQTSAPVIVCLDADDKLRPSYLEKGTAIFEKRPEVGIVSADVQVFGAYQATWSCGPCRLPEMLVLNRIQSASLFRREAWERVGGYRAGIPMAVQDWDLWLSILELGFEAEVIGEVLIDYRAREGSMWHSSGPDPQLRGPIFRAIWEAHASTYEANLGAVAELLAADAALGQQREAALQAELDTLRHRIAGAEQALQDVLSSSSWRITTPLRAIKRAIRPR